MPSNYPNRIKSVYFLRALNVARDEISIRGRVSDRTVFVSLNISYQCNALSPAVSYLESASPHPLL